MNPQEIHLPQGWDPVWDQQSGQYMYRNSETGQTQWEVPTQAVFGSRGMGDATSPAPAEAAPAHHHSKRRQYPTQQMAEVYGTGQAAAGPGYDGGAAYGQQPPAQGGYAGGAGQAPQFITPGMPATGAQQGGYAAGAPGYGQQGGVDQMSNQFQNMNVGGQAGPYGQQQAYGAQQQPAYGQPAYGQQQPAYGQPQQQWGGAGAGGGGYGQQPKAPKQLHQLQTVNLIGMQPDVRGLDAPPPPPLVPDDAISPYIQRSPTLIPDPSYQRCTLSSMPTTQSLLNKSKLPLALVMAPYRSTRESDGDEPVAVVSDSVIARCRRCRAYINPYVTFVEGENRWKCPMCDLANEVPQLFDFDSAGHRHDDRYLRPELNNSVVEFIASSEYLTRPPQPPVYCFLIDVSAPAIQSGMVSTAARAILESLEEIPNKDQRTKVAFIAVNTNLHFFSLPAGEDAEASMMVVSDLDDVFLPKPFDLLVNLTESRPAIENLLGKLSDMFQDSHVVGNALGSGLQAALELIGKFGGKIVCLSGSLPTLGAGALKPRDDPKLLGTPKETSLLQAASSFYKSFTVQCSKWHVSIDMFLTSSAYTDVASLSCLPRYTSGQTYLYPGFNASRSEDAIKFANELSKVLATPIGLEAVIRVRASRGIRMSGFHGNFFTRSSDLLSLPTLPLDQNYVIELQLEEDLKKDYVVIQTAVLHTTCNGERRIRVITQALPTTDSVAQLFASADQIAITSFLANKAVEKVLGGSSLEDARNVVTNRLCDMLSAYKNQVAGSSGASAQLAIPANLALLPLLCCALVKHVGLREGATIPPDLRAYAHDLLTTLPVQSLIPYIHARFYCLHDMPAEAGTIGENGVVMPPAWNLTSERLVRHGLFLIEDGQNMFLWVGQEAVPRLMEDVFGLPSYAELQGGKAELPQLDNAFNQRVNAIVAKTRELRRGVYRPNLYIVKSDAEPALRSWALSLLIEDRMDHMSSYAQYLTKVKNKVNGS